MIRVTSRFFAAPVCDQTADLIRHASRPPRPIDDPLRSAHTMSKQQISRGFTLIELMVVVAIVGILAAIALPAYSNYVLRSKLVAGTNLLSTIRAQMEQYYLDNRTYMTVSANIVSPCTSSANVANPSNLFNVNCTTLPGDVPTATTYVVRATGTGAVAGAVYTIDQTGAMATTGYPTSWGTAPAGLNCWVMRKGDTC
jgi:type IV pilus assembly protein PilE